MGGALIQGHKGTGKSTAARALAQLLPYIEVVEDPRDSLKAAGPKSAGGRQNITKTTLRPMPFIELPLNATEDRLVGSLHIEKALQTGERRFEPGLPERQGHRQSFIKFPFPCGSFILRCRYWAE